LSYPDADADAHTNPHAITTDNALSDDQPDELRYRPDAAGDADADTDTAAHTYADRSADPLTSADAHTTGYADARSDAYTHAAAHRLPFIAGLLV
jgi:hypothetical protein